MKNQPLELSVIVPTYDRPDAIARFLDALVRQTLAPERFEVIIVDDGSPTPVRIDVDRLPFHCELRRQKNQGPAAARIRLSAMRTRRYCSSSTTTPPPPHRSWRCT